MRYILLILLLVVPSVLQAQDMLSGADSDKPIEIAADSLEVLQDQQKAIFSGAVEAVQGSMTMLADKMTVHYRGNDAMSAGSNRIKRIVVVGNVKLDTSKESAQGNAGVYDVDAQEVRLKGNVKLMQGQNNIQGTSLVYSLKTGRSTIQAGGVAGAKSGSGTGRVRGVFIPEGN